jgi:hypothetical membrane protein
MNKNIYAFFGIFGPLLVYFSIIFSLFFSPWFDWNTNALSDLGNPSTSKVALEFNLGLMIAGFFIMIYAMTIFKKYAKYTSYCLLGSSFFVQMLASFNIGYGSLHYAVALPHFLLLSISSIVYSIETRSVFAFLIFLIVLFSWLIYSLQIFNIGIAVPEAFSKLVLLWIIYSGIKIYFRKMTINKL